MNTTMHSSPASSTVLASFAPDDRVYLIRVPRTLWHAGQRIPAVIRRIGAKQVEIELRHRPLFGRYTDTEVVLKWVSPTAIEPRQIPCSALGEEMRLEVDGFTITSMRHPAPPPRSMPRGIFYGMVDGLVCTAPLFTHEAAMEGALLSLQGRLRSQLIATIEVCGRKIEAEQAQGRPCPSANAELSDARQRLAKLLATYPEQAEAPGMPQ